MMHRFLFFLCFAASLSSCKQEPKPAEEVPVTAVTPAIGYNVSAIIPHDTKYFTEGFLVYDGKFLESTGSPLEISTAESLISTVDMTTGTTDEKIKLDKSLFFGEGIVVVNDKLYQVTYKNQIGFIYDAKTFRKTGEFKYTNKEGWGLTTDGKHVIMSDGTDQLTYFLPPEMKVVKTTRITENDISVLNINELEWIKGFIYANVWQTSDIIKIDPANGKVVGKIDLTSLKNEASASFRYSEVLNGIAFDSINNKVYVTGKMWPSIYRIEFEH